MGQAGEAGAIAGKGGARSEESRRRACRGRGGSGTRPGGGMSASCTQWTLSTTPAWQTAASPAWQTAASLACDVVFRAI